MDRHRRFTAASFRKYLAEADPTRADFEKITMVVSIDGDHATIHTYTMEDVERAEKLAAKAERANKKAQE